MVNSNLDWAFNLNVNSFIFGYDGTTYRPYKYSDINVVLIYIYAIDVVQKMPPSFFEYFQIMLLHSGSQPGIVTITAPTEVRDAPDQQPEIVTVQETIVTVNAQNSMSSSDTSLASDKSDQYRFRTMGNYAKVIQVR